MTLTKLQQEKHDLQDYLNFEKLCAAVESGVRHGPEFSEAVRELKRKKLANGMTYEQLYINRKNSGVEIPVVHGERFGKQKSKSRDSFR